MNTLNTKYAIEVKKVSKKYSLVGGKLKHYFLRDEISNIFKRSGSKNKSDKPFWALTNVSFSIKKGEAIGIIGPNGAGKSTILKILSRITYPTSGEVKLYGRVASLLEIGTGFNPELTGRENIYLNGTILGMKKKEITLKFKEIVDFAEIDRFIDVPVKRYSSGMYVRLAFSIAAHLEPEILIIDEVLAVGDARFQRKSLGKMNEVTRKDGRTVLFVSHDLNSIRRLCTKTLLIDKGKVVAFGPTDKVINKYLGQVNKNIPLAGGDIKKTVTRQGSGEIRVEKIYMSNSKGRKVQSVSSGDDVFFNLEFEVNNKSKIKNLLVGLLFKTELGQPVFLSHNIMTGQVFPELSKKGKFILKIKKLPLTQGTYYVNYSLMKNNGLGGEYYDNIDDAFKLVVNFGDYYKTSILPNQSLGATLVTGVWNLNK